MICNRCAVPLLKEDSYEQAGRVLCEDCYINAVSAPKTCDPWAVYTATRPKSKDASLPRELQGILDLLQDKGPLSLEQICSELDLSEERFRASFATLRHMENWRKRVKFPGRFNTCPSPIIDI